MQGSEYLGGFYHDYQSEWVSRGMTLQAYCSRNSTRPLFRIVTWNRVNIFGQKQKDWLKMKEEAKVNYAFALKNYQQNGRGRSMKKFCEEEGYDYEKFMQYSRRGQKEYSVLKEADARQTSDKL